MPTVSVVVPNYNHARFLRQRIDSILAQTFQDFELILLDDCSTDDSRTILSEYASDPRARLEFNETNSGGAFKQWNRAIRLARGEYVWIAESDDYADPSFLQRLLPEIDKQQAVTFAYCRSRQASPDGRVLGFADWYMTVWDPGQFASDFCMDGREMCQRYFSRINPVPNASAVLFRKEVYWRAGGADESLRLCGDWKLWAGMALEGRVAYLAEPLNFYRMHGGTLRGHTESAKVHVVEDLQLCRWVMDRVGLPEDLREPVRNFKASLWVPALISSNASLSTKRKVLKEVRAFDPRPFHRIPRPLLSTLRLKIRRHWREMRSAMAAGKSAGADRHANR